MSNNRLPFQFSLADRTGGFTRINTSFFIFYYLSDFLFVNIHIPFMKRRSFVKSTVMASTAFTILPSVKLAAAQERKIKLGFIGVGLRGQSHVNLALRRKDTDIYAICDIDDRMLKDTLDAISKAGKPTPKIFKGDPYA